MWLGSDLSQGDKWAQPASAVQLLVWTLPDDELTLRAFHTSKINLSSLGQVLGQTPPEAPRERGAERRSLPWFLLELLLLPRRTFATSDTLPHFLSLIPASLADCFHGYSWK